MKYNKILLLILFLVFFFLFSCSSTNNMEIADDYIFQALDEETEKYDWGINNKDKAIIFEEIYFSNYKDNNFLHKLFSYLDSIDKYYWIGIYLDSEYYTSINNYELSLEILIKGLNNINDEKDKIRFLWIIGKKLYHNNEKKESLEYLKKAYLLSQKYPGNTPTWKNREEAEEIYAYIESNL